MLHKRFSIHLSLVLVGMLATGFVQFILAQDQPKPKARISGQVMSAASKPLAGVKMRAFGRNVGMAIATTDEGGNYSIEVEPGQYTLSAQRKGYVGAFYKLEDSASETTPLTVEGGQHLGNINFYLAKGGVITGRILDERGDPLIGEEVSIIPKEKEKFRGFFGRSSTTDDRGIYRIYGLPSGTYYVSVQIDEDKMVEFDGSKVSMSQQGQTTYYAGTSSFSEASEVTVTEGLETTGIDFKLKTGPSRDAKIFGRVTNGETGEPMSGIMLYAHQTYGPGMQYQAFTDAEGRYELKSATPGKYRVRAHDPRAWESDQEQETIAALSREVVVESEPVELNLEFGRGGKISGHVILEGNRIPEEVTELMISVQPIGEEEFDPWRSPPKPDREGRFTVKAVPRGVYQLRVRGRRIPYYVKSVLLDNVDVRESGIAVESGDEIRDVLIVLSDVSAVVRGRVMGERGPLPGASVSVVSVDILTTPSPESAYQNRAMTDQRGQFELKTIRPGRYFVYAYGGRPDWKGTEGLLEFLRRSQDRLQVVDLKANETKEVNLTLMNVNQP